ncbi:MAG: hypothetical protein IJ279_01500 [Clostridia bacterium]|nr:hypothetical protein [Clostridia bacterium]
MSEKSIYDKKREVMVLDESQWKVDFPVYSKVTARTDVKSANAAMGSNSSGRVANSKPKIDADNKDDKKKKFFRGLQSVFKRL